MSLTKRSPRKTVPANNRNVVPLMTARYALRLQAIAPHGQRRRHDHMLARLAGSHLVLSPDALAALDDARFFSRELCDTGARRPRRLPESGQKISRKRLAKLLGELRDWDDSLFLQLLSEAECAITTRLEEDLTARPTRLTDMHALLGLTEEELVLLDSLTCRCLRPLLDEMMDFETASFRASLRKYARLLGVTLQALQSLLSRDSRLIKYELATVEPGENTLRRQISAGPALSGWLTGLDMTLGGRLGHTFEPLPAGQYGSADFRGLEKEWVNVAAALCGALKESASGVNIVIYAGPGGGKTEFVKGMLTNLGFQGYLIGGPTDRESAGSVADRLSALQTTLELMTHRDDAVLVMDHADEVIASFPPLPNSGPKEIERGDCSRQWVLNCLERNPLPVIWLCNKKPDLDDGYLRRFQIQLRLPALAPAQRRDPVAQPASEAQRETGAQHSPAEIETALNFAGGLADADQANRREVGTATASSSSRPRSYSLEFLNLNTHVPLAEMIRALARKRQGSLIFYGLPGTGKTALVEHIADQIGMRLTRVCASSLLGQYVGETERNIASMFAQAEADEAILFLDEADSFFRNRSYAERAWEVSQVNEMLQRMERHAGIFICATNLIQELDPAVLRRFSFKIEFRALNASQRESLFIAEALAGDPTALNAEHLAMLHGLDGLTPGDFHVVRQQVELLDEQPSPVNWLARLSAEWRSKNQGKRAIGFGM